VKLDILVDPFGARWSDVRATALAAEEAGLDGLWTWDHLAGGVHRADRVLEAWTVLTAVATLTERLMIGPMVLNVANRDPGTLAVMAATLQEVSGGRLLLGLGAGGGRNTPYAAEQLALGRAVPSDPVRRRTVATAVTTLHEVWSGARSGVGGFVVPDPAPPVLVGAFGPKMAELAGRAAEGLNTPAGPGLPGLADVARRAHAAGGRDPARFVVTACTGWDGRLAVPGSTARQRIEQLGVDRLLLVIAADQWRRISNIRP
jgi:alkanesulfonate monooxygenase SsuD/methylene tetrahydromethanopterin reductase-like flavin-dependent oxidoreductase (luciferase family)